MSGLDQERYPRDLDAERQILGALMLRPDLIVQVSSAIHKEEFFLAAHQIIYDAIITLFNQSTDVDQLSVTQYLVDHSLLDKAGGQSYIFRLAEDALAPGSAIRHSGRVHNLAVRRRLIQTIEDVGQEAFSPQEDERAFLRSVEDRILKITNQAASHGIESVQDMREDFTDYMNKLLEAKGGYTGQRTLFTEFDDLTSGVRGGELLILAARPGMGKTTWGLNIASNIGIRSKKPVLIFSLEMSKFELLLRFVCSEAQVNLTDMKRGRIPSVKTQPVLNAIEKIFNSPIHIDDSGTLDIWEVVTRSRKFAIELAMKEQTPGLIIVDYLQLVGDQEAKKFGRQNEVASVSRNLKQLAKTVNAPVLALSQMNRSVESRKGDSARPQLSDLRESGSIEQDADIVMFIHQDKGESGEENTGTAEIILAKHRHGPQGNFQLAFRPEICRFDNRVSEPVES